MLTNKPQLPFPHGRAICYSGFRDGQSPETASFPTSEQVKEDLLMLQGKWKYLRLYDCDQHALTVLELIEKEKLDFKVYLGAYIVAEQNNPNCPWEPEPLSNQELKRNKKLNIDRINELISLANKYSNTIIALSVGNEATVEWTDHLVPVESVVEYVSTVKKATDQPVSFCENYVPWLDKLEPLVAMVDFISIHTYPVWEYKSINEGLAFTKKNFQDVASRYPHKAVIISEAGWATKSNGRGIHSSNASEQFQKRYLQELLNWTDQERITTFYFEAFDENWKGSDDVLEPEKHWGLYYADRNPKLSVK